MISNYLPKILWIKGKSVFHLNYSQSQLNKALNIENLSNTHNWTFCPAVSEEFVDKRSIQRWLKDTEIIFWMESIMTQVLKFSDPQKALKCCYEGHITEESKVE